jgi:serine O-acetyltransferase
MYNIKLTITDIKNDLPNAKITLKSFLVSYLYSPRFRILLNHRIGKYLYHKNVFVLRQIAIYYKTKLVVKRSCDISYNSTIGKNLRMPHPIGIVIGDGVVIKDNVMVFQQVTFGSHGKKGIEMKYPIIENGVIIYAGAKIIGGVTIGENAIIGTNTVVNIDVPPNSIAVGIPCKINTKNG